MRHRARFSSSSDPTALWRPASLTKLMTLYLTFEEVAAGRLKLADILTVSAYAAAMPPSELGLSKGEKISVETRHPRHHHPFGQ